VFGYPSKSRLNTPCFLSKLLSNILISELEPERIREITNDEISDAEPHINPCKLEDAGGHVIESGGSCNRLHEGMQ
jgi:hypothetical protein